MKKRILTFMIILALLLTCAPLSTISSTAASEGALQKALVLQTLGIFTGTGKGLDLDRQPSRAEGAIILTRLMGKEQEAIELNNSHPFEDVPQWAASYVGYLYNNQLAYGTSQTRFGADDLLSVQSFTTFILRCLGYDDTRGDFTLATAVDKAAELGLITNPEIYKNSRKRFTRADVGILCHAALRSLMKDSDKSLVEKLIDEGAISPQNLLDSGLLGPVPDTDGDALPEGDLPITNVVYDTQGIAFSLSLDSGAYHMDGTTLSFTLKRGDSFEKALWILENIKADVASKRFYITDSTEYIGKLITVGNASAVTTGDSLSFAAAANTNGIKSGTISAYDVRFVQENGVVFIKLEPFNETVKSDTVSKNMKNNLLLVNRDNILPDGYKPTDLVSVDSKKLTVSGGGQRLTKITAEALYTMIAQGKKENVTGFIANSGYRDIQLQKQLFNNRLSINKSLGVKDPMLETQKRVALPGASEHHTGMALDILSVNGTSADTFGKTSQSQWLKANSWKFGFVVRYAEEKQNITLVMYEPWHIRYLGYPCAAVLYKENLCYEEFINHLNNDIMKVYQENGKTYLFIHTDSVGDLNLLKGMGWEVSVADKDKYIVTLSF